MRFVKKLEKVILAESVLCILTLTLIFVGWHFDAVVFFILIIQIMILIYTVTAIVHPLKEFARILDYLCETEFEEEELRIAPSGIPFVKQTYRLMDRYAAYKTRKDNVQILNKQTELTALQSQINPHFLYNTLETIRGQALIDDNIEIAKMVEALSAFFRYSISRKGNLVTLRDELVNIENYMLIQRYRFNNRFSLEVIVDEEDEQAYDFLIPRLIIQPVVENAIFHGLEEKLEDGKVIIEIIVTDQNLILTISDNGKGMDSDKLKELNFRIQSDDMELDDGKNHNTRNTGIGLPNIHKRIQLLEKMGTKGKVAVMQGAPTAPNHAERYQAHLNALAQYPDIEVIDGGIDNDNVETAQSQAAAVLAANPDLTGYLNCDACGSGVAAAIEEKGMQDKVTFVAMDNLIEILDYVKTGTITATSSTLPQEQGMYAVLMAYQAAQGMPLPANVDTGIGRITSDNIDEWIETVSAK